MALFIGRIPRDMGTRDLEDRFSKFGKITRLDVKQGFGFVEFEDKRDAEDAMNGVNESQELVVEWAKNGGKRAGENECFHCGKEGHWARDCRERGRGGDRGDRGYGSRGGRDRSPRRDQGRGSDRDRRGGRDYDRRRDDRGRDRSPRRDDYRSDERRGGDRRDRDREYAAPREDRERREDVERAPERDVHDRD
ncbi:CCHC-type zinc finger transcription factor [Phycomyces blakesleeanus]|uniref:CCHC-type zinc finger transcription factor n=1 Tax=Phycomyces blakesleeanus TaxID=4837 RepID=A0ABR3B2H9_PHYBL